jgi:hypothetical protein
MISGIRLTIHLIVVMLQVLIHLEKHKSFILEIQLQMDPPDFISTDIHPQGLVTLLVMG